MSSHVKVLDYLEPFLSLCGLPRGLSIMAASSRIFSAALRAPKAVSQERAPDRSHLNFYDLGSEATDCYFLRSFRSTQIQGEGT